jgi:hypothetical protein
MWLWFIIINYNNYYTVVYLKNLIQYNKNIYKFYKMLDTIEIKYMIEDMNNFDLFINKKKINLLHLKKAIDCFFSR